MTVLLVLFSCFCTAFLFIKMLSPFLQNKDEQLRFEVLDEDLKTLELLAQQRSFYVYQLKEIEEDFKANKLTQDDYALFKRRFEREIILLMRHVEEIHGGKGWEDRVRLAYETYLGNEHVTSSPPLTTPASGAVIEPEVFAPDVVEPEALAPVDMTCDTCLEPLSTEDRFCSQCGTPVVDHHAAATPEDDSSSEPMEARS